MCTSVQPRLDAAHSPDAESLAACVEDSKGGRHRVYHAYFEPALPRRSSASDSRSATRVQSLACWHQRSLAIRRAHRFICVGPRPVIATDGRWTSTCQSTPSRIVSRSGWQCSRAHRLNLPDASSLTIRNRRVGPPPGGSGQGLYGCRAAVAEVVHRPSEMPCFNDSLFSCSSSPSPFRTAARAGGGGCGGPGH